MYGLIPENKTVSKKYVLIKETENLGLQISTWYWNADKQTWQSVNENEIENYRFHPVEMLNNKWNIFEEITMNEYVYDCRKYSVGGFINRYVWDDKNKNWMVESINIVDNF